MFTKVNCTPGKWFHKTMKRSYKHFVKNFIYKRVSTERKIQITFIMKRYLKLNVITCNIYLYKLHNTIYS